MSTFSSCPLSINGRRFDFRYRGDSIGDKGVITQIFQHHDYRIDCWQQGQALIKYHEKNSPTHRSLIVDAGANIGASAVYFSQIYSNALVFAIEPDSGNFRLLETNTSQIENVHRFHGAISDTDGELFVIDPGRSDWGFMTSAAENSALGKTVQAVKSISPAGILAHPVAQNTTPLILKIDIEGGEEALFRGDVSWMNAFPLIIIELHDWMLPFSGSSRNFLKAAAQFEFDFLYRNENVFLFNRSILAPGGR